MAPESVPNPFVLSSQEKAFIEKNGLHYEKTHDLPRIAGRIIGLLMVSAHPITINEIRKTLQFSHGSISTNLRLLGMMGLVEKVTFPGDRCDYYQFSPRNCHCRFPITNMQLQRVKYIHIHLQDTPLFPEPHIQTCLYLCGGQPGGALLSVIFCRHCTGSQFVR